MMRPNTPPFTTEGLLEEIRSWVLIESPTTDETAVNDEQLIVSSLVPRASLLLRLFETLS